MHRAPLTQTFLQKPLKVVLQTRNHQNIMNGNSRRNNDNDVGTFVMLKYGRNEKMTFCVFIGHEQQKLFWGIFIPIIKYFRDFLANVLKKGLFLTSTTQTLPIFNGENCSFDGFFFFYIRLQASSLISMRNRSVYDVWIRFSILLTLFSEGSINPMLNCHANFNLLY